VDLDVSLDYALTLLAALLIGLGFVLQQQAAQAEPASRFLSLRLILDLLRTPRWLVGIASMIAGQVLAAWSIGNLSLGFVEPLLTTNLVFALVLAVPIAKAKLRFWEIFGAAVLCTGVALLSASRSAKPIGLSFGSVSHWPAAAVIAGIAFLAVQTGRRHPGRTRAMLTGTAAGLVFGIQDALTRQTLQILQSNGAGVVFTTWAPYALVGAGATGIWLMQSAFSAGPLPESLPAISAGEPVVGILLGVLVFGDRIQITPGELALQAAGIAALIVGVIIVGRAPALSQLRAWTPPSLPHVPHVPHVPLVPRVPHNLATIPGRHAKRPAKPAKPARPGAGHIRHVPGDAGLSGGNGSSANPASANPASANPASANPASAGTPASAGEPADTFRPDTFRPDTLALPARRGAASLITPVKRAVLPALLPAAWQVSRPCGARGRPTSSTSPRGCPG
jgi:drug/metabolite transporter (DMT)-like permease